MKTLFTCFIAITLMACNGSEDEHSEDYGSQLGTVNIAAACNEQANPYLQSGLALLHHMTYEGSRSAFIKATEMDPACSLAYWGHAMTFIHPLWSDPPKQADFEKGQALLGEARSHADTEQEIAYINAAEAYYSPGKNTKEKVNLIGFAEAWKQVHEQYPEDTEASSFYALALMSTADPEDKQFSKQLQAGAIVEKVLVQNPEHPGAHHYIVHAYDSPPLADKALAVAHQYGNIAPNIPHALHMPTHIFTRLGYWQESIDMNLRSASAALEHPAGDHLSLHYLHALDYLAYAHLQRAEDAKAKDVLVLIEQIEGPIQSHVASAYTLAAVPARLALERQEWSDATLLKVNQPKDYPWDKFPAMEAITQFAIALGAARNNQPELAASALERLTVLHEKTAQTSAYWAKQIQVQKLAAEAWLNYESGNQEKALDIMRTAAELEATTEKHPVTPGEVLPARELLADMLIEMKLFEQAEAEYELALQRSPNRFNSLYGLGRAAELSGDNAKAQLYYGRLVELSTQDSAERPQLQHAKAFAAVN